MGKPLLIGMTALAIAAVLVGVFMVGGPFKARQANLDEQRLEDLNLISSALRCSNWRILDPELPEEMTLESLRAYCGGVLVHDETLKDPETGDAYIYTRSSPTEYAVCATFYDADLASRDYRRYNSGRLSSFNPETGCITGKLD